MFALGLALIAVPLNSPLETLSDHYLLLFHLLQNALIADWGPPLLILGLTPLMRQALTRTGGVRFEQLTSPVVALPLWVGVWYGVHVPPFYDWALQHGWPLNLEHGLLIGVGLVFWWPIFEHPRRMEPLGVLAYLGIALRHRPLALTRLHLLVPPVLRLLRARTAALGTLRSQGSELRRDPDERRPDEHLLHRIRVAPPACPRKRRGGTTSPEMLCFSPSTTHVP